MKAEAEEAEGVFLCFLMLFGSRNRGVALGSENFLGLSASLRCAMSAVSGLSGSTGTVVPARRLMLERPLSFVVAAVAETERSIIFIFITLFSSLGATVDEVIVGDVVGVGGPPFPLTGASSVGSSSKDPALFFLPNFGLEGMMIGEGREVAALSRADEEEGEDNGDSRLLSSFMPFFVATELTLGDGPNRILS